MKPAQDAAAQSGARRTGARWALDERFQTVWLVIALVVVSATKLRLGSVPVGIGEVLLLGWLLYIARGTSLILNDTKNLQAVVAWFWMTLAVFMAFGAVWARAHDVASPGAGRDALAFAFAALFSVMTAGVLGRTLSIMRALRWTVALIAVYMGALAVVHLVNPAAVTEPAQYGYRLVALTNNPNQLALYLAPLPFLVIFLITRARTIAGRTLLFAALVLCILASRAVGSDAVPVSWLVGAASLACSGWLLRAEARKAWRGKWIAVATALVLLWSVGGLLNRFVAPNLDSQAVTRWLPFMRILDPSAGHEAANEYWEKNQVNTRLGLWRSGLEVVSLSPIVGFGPGRHAGAEHAFQGDEVHNSFLDLATMAGVPGGLLLIWLFLAVARPHVSMHETHYAACVILLALAAYASFHFVIRQPIFWFYVLLAGSLVRNER